VTKTLSIRTSTSSIVTPRDDHAASIPFLC
jgi:hypothetical protein